MLEDEGIEDMHFYIVAFNNHKRNILKKMEHKNKNEKLKNDDKYAQGLSEDDKTAKNIMVESKIQSESRERTIESVEEVEIF